MTTWMKLEGVMLTEKKSGREREMLNVFIQIGIYKSQIHRNRGLGVGGNREVLVRVQSSSYKTNKFRESNVQHDDYSEQCPIIYLRPAKSIDLKGYHHTHTHTQLVIM